MNFVKKITLSLCATFFITGAAIATEPTQSQLTVDPTSTMQSQTKGQPETGYCWVFYMNRWFWIC